MRVHCMVDQAGIRPVKKYIQMKKGKMFYWLIVISFLGSMSLENCRPAVPPDSEESVLIRKCTDFSITGDGKSENWASTNWIMLNRQDQGKVDYRTRAKVLYSETGIYFLFDCEDRKLTSTLQADNLDLYTEDVVEVFLWTGEDFPVYFEYEISPLDFELPIIIPNNRGTFLGWLPWKYEGDRKVRHATSVKGGMKESDAAVKGWMAEFFIPFRLLAPLGNVPPVPGTRWRANMYRIDYDQGATHFSWRKTSGSFHEYNKFGIFIFE